MGLTFILIGCETKSPNENSTSNDFIYKCIDSLSYEGYCDKYCEIFYPTGELKATYTTRFDSIMHGVVKTFYKNGKLEDSTFFAGGIILNVYQSFYSNGDKKEVIDYVALSDKNDVFSYRNRYVEYDSITGEILENESFYYKIELSSETSKDGDSLTVNFNFILPKYKDTAYIELGNYDEFFRISKKDKEKTRKIPVIDYKAEFKVEVEKIDDFFIRGIICNFDKIDTTKRRLFYFYEKYKVE